jgi:hypothetical protein
LEYTDSLFSRWSLRKNVYLFKHIEPNLEIPFYIIAEERRISQITHSHSILIEVRMLVSEGAQNVRFCGCLLGIEDSEVVGIANSEV